MTFSCKNYDYNTDKCLKLHAECVPGRRGCVLEGRVAVSEELRKRLDELDKKAAEKKRERSQTR
ncbi:MAG: hypothetical protein BM485_08680 [Desulfobulbaceae bacterium DB1]|nr:MAG: hypothetical protein BM485_08680 [Desulfobulbaceae bacterium DB1]